MPHQSSSKYPMRRLYSFAAAAEILGKSKQTLFRWAYEGRLVTVDTPVGRHIHVDEIRRWLGEGEPCGAALDPSGCEAAAVDAASTFRVNAPDNPKVAGVRGGNSPFKAKALATPENSLR